MGDLDQIAKGLSEEAFSIARRLPLHHAEWIQRYDESDPEWCPPRMAMAFLRMGLIRSDVEEGGYRFTPLGLQVRTQLLASKGLTND